MAIRLISRRWLSNTRGPGGLGTTPKIQNVTKLNDPSKSLLNVVFCNPLIPANTGSMGRTCIGLGTRLHLIKPLGFDLDDAAVKRSGLDYWPRVDLHIHENWAAFNESEGRCNKRFFFTREANESVVDATFTPELPIYLIFGNETSGFSNEIQQDIDDVNDVQLAFPMEGQDIIRCFNLSTTATMALWQTYYQLVKR
eukprot:m.62489 g.62489  ORF g.62489 m.62489 type:complete len:197 (-) comp23163_c0_seq1:83-673(-)